MAVKKIVNLVLAVAAFGSFAMAQDGRGANQPRGGQRSEQGSAGGNRDFGGRGRGMMGASRIDFNRLNLTDAQKQQIQTLLENNRKSFDANRTQFEEMGNLMRLKHEGLLTTEQGTRLTALEAQMKTNMDRMHSDLSAILTPDQRTLLEQMQHGGGRGDGMRDGGGERMRPGRGGSGGQRPGAPNGGGMSQQTPNDNN